MNCNSNQQTYSADVNAAGESGHASQIQPRYISMNVTDIAISGLYLRVINKNSIWGVRAC